MIQSEILSLFLKYDIPPQPRAVTRLRTFTKRKLREIERIMGRGSGPENRLHDLEARQASIIARFNGLVDGLPQRHNVQRFYRNWRPVPDDWIRLSVRQAAAHDEPGFKAEETKSDAVAEMRFHREGLIRYFLSYDKEGHRRTRPATFKDAAKLAVNYIEAEIRRGVYPEWVDRKRAEGGWAAKEYGQRQRTVSEMESRLSDITQQIEALEGNHCAPGIAEELETVFNSLHRQLIEALGIPAEQTNWLGRYSKESELVASGIRATLWPADANAYGESGGYIAPFGGDLLASLPSDISPEEQNEAVRKYGRDAPQWLAGGGTVKAEWTIPAKVRKDDALRVSFTKLPPTGEP